jgi:D-alanyl-D-alanine carboxypeptidase
MAKPTYPNNRFRSARPKSKRLAAPKIWFVLAALAVLAVPLGAFWLLSNRDVKPAERSSSEQQAPAFDKQRYSLTDPASPWVVVNKKRPLTPKTYEPATLRLPDIDVESEEMVLNDQAATALEKLVADAKQQRINLVLASAYRPYSQQVIIYNSVVKGFGQLQADRESARPGHSEHQTGWAADLGAANGKCRIEACFTETPEGKWLASNAYKYGFILRYADGKESITGYQYEPWHLRYVGTELSTEMRRTNVQTLEEFFGLPAAPNY